jgi:hypothetical protein
MGTEKYASEIKTIASPQELVYNYLSDLKNLEQLFDPERIEALKNQYPHMPDVSLDNFRATADECSFSINPIGLIGVRIIERDPSKLIKLTGNQSVPFQFTCWIQLLPIDDANCKLKITLHAELSIMIKVLVDKHLKDGINRIADALTKIAYA